MTLRNRTLIATGLFLVFLLAVVYILTTTVISNGFGRIEARWAGDNLVRVQESFKSLIDDLTVKSADWAVWSDTYNFILDHNANYITSNLGDVSIQNLQISYILILDTAGQVVFQKRLDLASGKEIEMPAAFLQHFRPGSPFLGQEDVHAVYNGVVMVDGAPVIFAARPVLTSTHEGPSRGTLVFARDLTQERLDRLSEVTKLAVKTLSLEDKAHAADLGRLLKEGTSVAAPQSADLLEGFVLVKDAYARPAFAFFVDMPRDINRQAAAMRGFLAAGFLTVSVVFPAVFLLLLHLLIFSRLTRLNRDIEAIRDPGSPGKRIDVHGSDELAQVGLAINHMLDQIQNSKEKLEQRMKELDQAKRTAENASRAKSQFLANMSHEIRTPLNSILGYAELLKRSQLNQDQRQYLETVTGSSKLLLSVISDILDISKIEESRLELERVDFDLNRVIDGSLNIVRPNIESKGLELRLSVDPAVPRWLKGDPVRLRQILVNLLGNAGKFTRHGRVGLDVALDPQLDGGDFIGVRFIVSDTGEGIPADKLEAIFEPFTQADTSTTRRFGGSGLGLTICRNLVRIMGGKIWVESEPAKGSRFIFNVRMAPGAPREEVEDAAAEPQVDLAGVRILVVEDSQANQQLLGAILSLIGCTADYANNGLEAIEHLKKDSDYDLCLMDMQMPFMGGEDAALYIRRHISKDLPIIALTAAVMKEDREGAFKAGVNDFLAKPIDMEKLKAAIQRHARHSRRPSGALQEPPEVYDWGALSREIGLPLEAYKDILRDLTRDFVGEEEQMARSIAGRDTAAVKSQSHRLKGTLANMRLKKISGAMASIEAAAAEGAWTEVERQFKAAAEEMEQVRKLFL